MVPFGDNRHQACLLGFEKQAGRPHATIGITPKKKKRTDRATLVFSFVRFMGSCKNCYALWLLLYMEVVSFNYMYYYMFFVNNYKQEAHGNIGLLRSDLCLALLYCSILRFLGNGSKSALVRVSIRQRYRNIYPCDGNTQGICHGMICVYVQAPCTPQRLSTFLLSFQGL